MTDPELEAEIEGMNIAQGIDRVLRSPGYSQDQRDKARIALEILPALIGQGWQADDLRVQASNMCWQAFVVAEEFLAEMSRH